MMTEQRGWPTRQIPWRDLGDPTAQEAARDHYRHRPIEKLPEDVLRLYDENHKLRKENNLQSKAILILEAEGARDRRNMIANWIVTVGQVLALTTALIKIFWLR